MAGDEKQPAFRWRIRPSESMHCFVIRPGGYGLECTGGSTINQVG
jgi:hypothetical protein